MADQRDPGRRPDPEAELRELLANPDQLIPAEQLLAELEAAHEEDQRKLGECEE